MTNPSSVNDRSTTEPEFGGLDISPAMAAELLLKRRRVRRSLLEWCRHCGYEPASHHRLLIDRLERVARGETKRLAVFMPPGSAKSTYGSILFPPYVMANAPSRAILAASHTTERAEKWGRRVRNLIARHSATLGVRLSDDSHAAGRWELDNGGEYYAAGVGAAIIGFRANGALIDDPIRSREDADSQHVRDKIWDWYKSDLLTRLAPGGWVILYPLARGRPCRPHHRRNGARRRALGHRLAAGRGRTRRSARPRTRSVAVGRCLWLWRAPTRGEGNPAPAQLVGALPAAAGARHRRLFQGRVVPHLHERAAASNAQHLWRIGLRRHLGWRRLHRARRYRRRPGKPHVSARSLAGADLLRYLDRGLVRFGEKMEAFVLGRGARADHCRRGPVPRSARNRPPRLPTPRDGAKPRV